VIEYNYDLFQNAKNDFNNAATSLSLLNPLVEKFQYCKVPKAVDTNIFWNIWTSCGRLIACGEDLKQNFKYLENAIKDMGLAEQRYLDAMGELDAVNAEIWDFATTPISGRVTLEEGEQMNQEITDLNERKRKLEEETAHLKDLLGIKTEEDKKWYESLEESMDAWYEDRKKLADSYKNIFTNETSGGFISNVSNYFQTLSEVNKNVRSTNQQVQSDIFRGIGNVGEKITDFATQIIGWLAKSAYKNPQAYTSPYLMYMEQNGFADAQVKIIENTTKAIVTNDTVDNWYTAYYETNKGKDINTYSYVKYDDVFAEAVDKATQSVVETGAVIALSTIAAPVGAVSAATFAGTIAGGDAVNKAYDNEATFDEATLYSTLVGGSYAATTYLGSQYFSNMMSKGGTFLPTQNVADALKATFKYNPALKRVILGTLTPTSIPIVGSVAEWLTWGSDYQTLEDLSVVWDKNDTTKNAIIAGLTGFGLTTGNEVAGSLLQGKYLIENFKRDYPTLSDSEIDRMVKNTYFLSGKEYLEMGSNRTLQEGGFNKDGKSYINLGTTGFNEIDNVIENVYHENTHSIGSIRTPFLNSRGYSSRGFNESITDLLAMRTSNRPSNAYNQEAIKILDSIEGVLDPSKKLLKNYYLYGDPLPIIKELRKKVYSSDEAEYLLMGIANSLQMAIESGTYHQGVEQLQNILDTYLLGG